MKVIVGVDGSPGSVQAAVLAGCLLSPDQDELLLYNSPASVYTRGAQRPDAETLDRARRAIADAVFDRVLDSLDPAWKDRVERICGEKKPAHGLLVAADERHAEMIVVGARGIGPLESVLVGSVSRAVAQHAPIPVLVVRSSETTNPDSLRLLMACDGSDASRLAGNVLNQLHWPEATVGRVVTVLESRIVGEVPAWLEEQARESDTDLMAKAWAEEHDEQRRTRRDGLRQFCRDNLPAFFQQDQPIVRDGHPAEQILKVIAEENVDIAVCGARTHSLWQQLLMGSTSQHLLSHAPCSVLVVRQHEKP